MNFEEAKVQAKAESKTVLMSFSGSDWCANCIRLERELFESPEFQSYAKEHLVLLKLDFPMKKKNQLSAEQTAHNEKLAEQFNQKGAFPTVIVFSADGESLGKMKHPQPTASAYIESLAKLTSR